MLGLLLLILALISQTTAGETVDVMDGCPHKCGDVHVPYPFGINFTSGIGRFNPKCALNSSFIFICNQTYKPPLLYVLPSYPIYNISVLPSSPIYNISVEEGTISVRTNFSAYNCYNKTGKLDSSLAMGMSLPPELGPFRISDTRNVLRVVGCNTFGVAVGWEDSSAVNGCFSSCDENANLKGCSGAGCCQTSLPKNITSFIITLYRSKDDEFSSTIWDYALSKDNKEEKKLSNKCEYAYFADNRTDISEQKSSLRPYSRSAYSRSAKDDNDNNIVESEIVIEWVVREETCEAANSSSNPNKYSCGINSYCIYSTNGNGFRCKCKDGFAGNPYLPQGCKDINECKDPDNYPCHGTCRNTIGNYKCKCPFWMLGDGKDGCRHLPYATILISIGATGTILVIAFLVVSLYKTRRNQANFLKNGGMVLKHQRVRIFTEAELVKATKNYDQTLLLGEGGFGCVYKGVLADETQIAVKKPKDKDKTHVNEDFQQEIGIVSQINHRNVVKVLGLCLETKAPLLVYEFISNGTLYEHIHGAKSNILNSWKNCLRIAAEAALALDYLHSLADPPIIHGDIKSSNILLDETYTAKVSDFGASVLISPNKSDMATKIQGTLGYLDPEYLMTGDLTEKSDVYSFGVVLVELLTGEKPNSRSRSGEKSNIVQFFLSSLENNDLSRDLCFEVGSEREMEEIEHFAEVAKHCLHNSGGKRPTMKEVAEELGRLRKLHESSWDHHQGPEETQHLLGESSYSSIYVGSPIVNQQDTFSTTTFEVEFSTGSI